MNSTRKTPGDSGYTLVGLIAIIAVSGILLASIAPTWRHLVIRDREEELIFRGEQYKQAIERYRVKFNALPLKLGNLLKQKMIRKLYKDPMTGYDFELIFYSPGGQVRESQLSKPQRESQRSDLPGGSSLGIVGVVSTSPDEAIRPYDDKQFYNEWEFIAEEGGEAGETSYPEDQQGDDDDDG